MPAEAVVTALSTDVIRGLGGEEVVRRQRHEGFNELPEAPPASPLKLFLSQFASVIIWVLIAAALISGLLKDWIDTAAILAIVFLNGLFGFAQEFRAERSLAALRKLSVATARVIRDGQLQSIPARELVRGDLLLFEAGDHIPADARLIYTTNFQTQEASLTGESTPVGKRARCLARPAWTHRSARLPGFGNWSYLSVAHRQGYGRLPRRGEDRPAPHRVQEWIAAGHLRSRVAVAHRAHAALPMIVWHPTSCAKPNRPFRNTMARGAAVSRSQSLSRPDISAAGNKDPDDTAGEFREKQFQGRRRRSFGEFI